VRESTRKAVLAKAQTIFPPEAASITQAKQFLRLSLSQPNLTFTPEK